MCLRNIDFALISLDHIINARDIDFERYYDENTYYFFHIQSLLTACGNISNIFENPYRHLPKNTHILDRCENLKDFFNIYPADYPLIFQKEARNTNEHADDRYQEFNGRLGDYNIIDENTPKSMRNEILSRPHLRTFDKSRMVYITFNRYKKRIAYDLIDLRQELIRMSEILKAHEVTNSAWGK